MAFQPVTNCVQATIVGTLNGESCVNTYYYTTDPGFGTTEMQALADAIDTLWGGFKDTWMYASYEYLRTEVRDLRTTPGLLVEADDEAGTGGLSGGSSIPNNVAISVKRSSGLTGKNARGRVFLPVTNTNLLNTPNEITSTFQAAIQDFLDQMLIIPASIDWVGVTVSRVVAGVPLTTAVTYAIVSWVIVNLTVDSMRRRLPGRGS